MKVELLIFSINLLKPVNKFHITNNKKERHNNGYLIIGNLKLKYPKIFSELIRLNKV